MPDDDGAQSWLLEAVDALTLMNQSCRSRIFLRKSVLEITETILREWSHPLGATFDFNMDSLRSGDYPVREMSIQWNESDSAFLQRLWCKHGIAWGISASGSSGPIVHTLVLFDASVSFPQNAAGTLRYQDDAAVQENDATEYLCLLPNYLRDFLRLPIAWAVSNVLFQPSGIAGT